MNKVILFATVVLICSCGHNEQENEKPASSSRPGSEKLIESYGEALSSKQPASVEALMAKLQENDSVSLKVSAEILSTCKMKGCWMNVALPGGDKMRVTFKDYAFFVPKEGMEGKTALMEGYAKRVITDVETLKHFAKDAGKSTDEIEAIKLPKEEIIFKASGVVIGE